MPIIYRLQKNYAEFIPTIYNAAFQPAWCPVLAEENHPPLTAVFSART